MGPLGHTSHPSGRPIVLTMESMSPAEELPALYRALLDRVAQIESEGRRAAAYRLRSEATRIYSKRWDHHARRALQDLLNRTADDRLAASDRDRRSRRSNVPAT
jgi:hypothetical protein